MKTLIEKTSVVFKNPLKLPINKTKVLIKYLKELITQLITKGTCT